MDIKEYDGKRIQITDIDGRIFKGMGKFLTNADNDDEGEKLLLRKSDEWVVEFYPEEIKKVEFVEA